MPKRQSISKKLRFEIFKRDNFTCQYCGNHPPQVVLEIDHIVSVSNDGKNDADNLVTSCFNCNRGKSDNPLTSVPQSLKEKSKDIAEREQQLLGYYQVINAKRERIEREAWGVIKVFRKEDSIRRDWFNSIKNFVEKIGFHEVYDAMEIACDKFPWSEKKTFLYFCGICWNIIKRAKNREHPGGGPTADGLESATGRDSCTSGMPERRSEGGMEA